MAIAIRNPDDRVNVVALGSQEDSSTRFFIGTANTTRYLGAGFGNDNFSSFNTGYATDSATDYIVSVTNDTDSAELFVNGASADTTSDTGNPSTTQTAYLGALNNNGAIASFVGWLYLLCNHSSRSGTIRWRPFNN